MKTTIRIGTRGSRLALVQAEDVCRRIETAFPGIGTETVIIKTEGDLDRSAPLASFGGRGAFVRSIETALLDNVIDAAVHSLKDLPSELPEGLALAAAPVREDPRDALVTRTGIPFDALPQGSVVGTGSDRRSTQLKARRPDLDYRGIRGNVETRLGRLDNGDYDAVVLATAGLVRLGLETRITERLDTAEMLPAPCQGAIGIECRESDTATLRLFAGLDNPDVRVCVDAERAFINTLGMGCHAPVGAYAVVENESVTLNVYVIPPDSGNISIRETVRAGRNDIVRAASDLARKILETA